MSLLSWFNRPTLAKPTDPPSSTTPGFHPPATANDLLKPIRRQQLLENIWRRASLSRDQFNQLYQQPLNRFAELVQLLPASANHHHAHLGGMLDHGLEIVAYALKIRQSYLLPIGAPPESQSAQAEAWTAAAAYGALIHDLGKIAVDVEVELQNGKRWHPWHGPISSPYRFRYVKGRKYQLHGAASALIYSQILDGKILDWLSGFPELWELLIYLLAGQYEHAGILGEIVVKADQASVAQELGGNPDRAIAAPKDSLARQLADGLRYLVRDKFKLNQPDGPSDGWYAADAVWLVSKPTADQLRALLLSQGIANMPSSNAPFFNMLQDQAVIQTNAQDKAVWKATIDNGRGWKNTFTLLKVAPALLWPDPADRPEPYSGSLLIEVAEDGAADPGAVAPETVTAVPNQPVLTQPTPALSTPSQSVHRNPAPPTDDDTSKILASERDELLALLGNINEPPPQTPDEPPQMTPLPTQSATAPAEAEPAVPHTPDVDKTPSMQTPSTPVELGQGFIAWLKTGITSHRLIINDAKALVHTVDGTAMLVSPGIFKRFVLEHPELERIAKAQEVNAWQLVQRAFEKQKQHRKTTKQLNIWVFNVTGPRKTKQLKGYLMQDPLSVFNEVPFDNPAISIHLPEALQ